MLLRGMSPRCWPPTRSPTRQTCGPWRPPPAAGSPCWPPPTGGSWEELSLRPLYRELLGAGIFQKFVFISPGGREAGVHRPGRGRAPDDRRPGRKALSVSGVHRPGGAPGGRDLRQRAACLQAFRRVLAALARAGLLPAPSGPVDGRGPGGKPRAGGGSSRPAARPSPPEGGRAGPTAGQPPWKQRPFP